MTLLALLERGRPSSLPPPPSRILAMESNGTAFTSEGVQVLPFTVVEFWLDFRKISLDMDIWEVVIYDSQSGQSKAILDKQLAQKATLFCSKQAVLHVRLSIKPEYWRYRNFLLLFRECCSAQVFPNQAPFEEANELFMFTVKRSDSNVILPLNSPNDDLLFGELGFMALSNNSQFKMEPHPPTE